MPEVPDTFTGRGLVQWSTEQWQFFAFIFAALVTLFFALVDELLLRYVSLPGWVVKLFVFFLLAWATLYCRTTKRCIVRALRIVKR